MDWVNDVTGTLNDLFSNNVDFVAKQMQVLIDFLYPDNEDNSETTFDSSAMPVLLAGQINIPQGLQKINGSWQLCQATYNLQFDSSNTDNQLTLLGKSVSTSDAAWSAMGGNSADWFFHAIESNVTIPQKMNGSAAPFTIVQSANTSAPITFEYGNASRTKQADLRIYFNQPDSSQSLSLETAQGYIYFLGDGGGNLTLVTDKNTAQNIYNNNYIYYNNDYHTSNTYNYDNGSVFVGGGAGGLVVGLGGMLNYGQIEFAIDSLIDDLNLNFNNSENQLPFDDFPSYSDLKYVDRGSFYITPVKQLDKLPVAPDIADTVIDVSEPLGILSTGFGALLDSFNNIGVTLTLTFTFLSCLIINKLRGD